MSDATSQETPPRFVVTLVHGTWASQDDWPKSSLLERKLKQEFPAAIFRAFPWTGHNNNAHRTEAQARLVERLQHQLAEFQEAKHFVVAHSHGTQVALFALRHPDIAGKIAGVIAMGSPFLISRPRNTKVLRANFWGWFGARLGVLLVALAVGSVLLGAELEMKGAFPRILNWPLNVVMLSPVIALFLFSVFPTRFRRLRRWCYRPLSRWIRTSQRNTASALGFENPDSTPMLFLTAREDETYWHLKFEGSVTQAFVWAYVACSISLLAPIALYAVAIPLALLAELVGFSGDGIFMFWALAMIWLPVAGAALMLFEMFFLPLFAALAANGLAFGWGKISTYLWSQVMVHRKPSHCTQLEFQWVHLRPGRIGRFRRGLTGFRLQSGFRCLRSALWGLAAHCSYYEDDACTATIVTWLKRFK